MACYKPGFYYGADESAICEALTREGYRPQRIEEPPNAIYESHKNLCDLLLAYIRGSAKVRLGDRVYDCRPGDRLMIPGDIEHSAQIGPDGVVYLMTEIECLGD